MSTIVGTALRGEDSIESLYKYKNKYLIYSIKIRKNKPLVVMFSGVDSVAGSHRLSYYGLREEIDASVLHIGDYIGAHGSYLLRIAGDDSTIREAVLSLIRSWQQELNVNQENIYLAGTSKGGTSAIAFSLMLGYGKVIVGEPQIRLGDFLYQPRYERIASLSAISHAMNGRTDPRDKDSLNELIPSITEKSGARYRGLIEIFVGTKTLYLERHILPFRDLAEKYGFLEKLEIIKVDAAEHVGIVGPFVERMRQLFLPVKTEPSNTTTEQPNGTLINTEKNRLPEGSVTLRVAILGSFALKRATDFFDRKAVSMSLYVPKISLGSVSGKPVAIPADSFFPTALDGFTKSLVARDINKSFFSELENKQPNVLIVDFLDEVFDYFLHRPSGTTVTNSNYFSRCNVSLLLADEWTKIDRRSDEAWSCWENGCKELEKKLNADTEVVLVRIFLPEQYASGGFVKTYSDHILERVRKNNKILERCYKRFSEIINCHVVDVQSDLMVTQTPENKGFNPTDFSDTFYSNVCKSISRMLHLEGLASESQSERIDHLFDLFSSTLDAGEISSIHELHTEGLRHLANGDPKRARWCERLITLLRNSSVPLTVKMGKVTFGYGGIGVVVHADCVLGDFVNVGTNVTLGGGKTSTDQLGVTRNVPHVESRVYIGTGAKLIGGITVGHHTIIGANAVVTHDVPPFSVVGGNPAKVINRITRNNISKYAGYLYKRQPLDEVARIMFGNDDK